MTQTQPNKQMVVVIAVIIALLFVGAFFFMKKSESPTTSNSMMDNDMMAEDGAGNDTSMMEGGKNTLMGLMGMGKNLHCDFNYETEGKAASQGSVYISGKKVHGEFTSAVEGQQTTMHMIQDGEYAYMWGSAMPEGIKMKIATDGQAEVQKNTGSTEYFDPNQQMDFNCQPWSVDASKFVVPTDVTFRDMSAMMAPSGAMKAGQCAACAQLQGEAKTMCEKQLGC